MTVTQSIQQAASECLLELYGIEVAPASIAIQDTRKEFEGDFTLVLFALNRYKLGAPEAVGEKLGKALMEKMPIVAHYNIIKGFLNLGLSTGFWRKFMAEAIQNEAFLKNTEGKGASVVVEYCSPNTNKPLHLGHLRNITLGYALTEILRANGYNAHPVCLYNDRGTAICKSMYAWQLAGMTDTPESTGKKGDVFVGDYYVAYDKQLKREIQGLQAAGLPEEEAKKQAPAAVGINEMLVQWEDNNAPVREMWRRMNQWVYDAHADTFRSLGISFEKFYYESEVYLDGKKSVDEGLNKGIFYRKDDGSVWVDLSDAGLDHKLLLRSNGTSVYITQDLAAADWKDRDYQMQRSIYVVGNEQDYHFKVLFEVLRKLGKPYAGGLFHLSYGMVELPEGKMKSREGTVVEADDLISELQETAREATLAHGRMDEMEAQELAALYHTLAIGALKFFLVKVDPKKNMVFDPKESLDLHGHTGPFIQYAFARTQSIMRRVGELPVFQPEIEPEISLQNSERHLLRHLFNYHSTLKSAGEDLNPALMANYAYELAQLYNSFYGECKVLQNEYPLSSAMRLALSGLAGSLMQECLRLLGIGAPSRM